MHTTKLPRNIYNLELFDYESTTRKPKPHNKRMSEDEYALRELITGSEPRDNPRHHLYAAMNPYVSKNPIQPGAVNDRKKIMTKKEFWDSHGPMLNEAPVDNLSPSPLPWAELPNPLAKIGGKIRTRKSKKTKRKTFKRKTCKKCNKKCTKKCDCGERLCGCGCKCGKKNNKRMRKTMKRRKRL